MTTLAVDTVRSARDLRLIRVHGDDVDASSVHEQVVPACLSEPAFNDEGRLEESAC